MENTRLLILRPLSHAGSGLQCNTFLIVRNLFQEGKGTSQEIMEKNAYAK